MSLKKVYLKKFKEFLQKNFAKFERYFKEIEIVISRLLLCYLHEFR